MNDNLFFVYVKAKAEAKADSGHGIIGKGNVSGVKSIVDLSEQTKILTHPLVIGNIEEKTGIKFSDIPGIGEPDAFVTAGNGEGARKFFRGGFPGYFK
jgi:hypothetical protein